MSTLMKTGRRDFLKRASLGGVVTATTLGTLGAHAASLNECKVGSSTSSVKVRAAAA